MTPGSSVLLAFVAWLGTVSLGNCEELIIPGEVLLLNG